ncbi:tetratricopeptide repeat protein [Paludibaculum fermentans]|uniref:Tetratricopeptide repeat protein n=1 Tax=Paludibaculum fermentans TaxID=1473598 RepID=A0A7S7SKD3_PALFE|nr:tetratricopeptide repeat protein [Paludibaculum fermentans]QOY87638.1 tetratricopeptide repeat protein [Paludibaculum fermentans]
MRITAIASVLVLALPFASFAQKKEIVELGRDLALLQEEVRTNAKSQSDRLSNIEATLKAIQDQLAGNSRALTVLDSGLKDRLEKQMNGPLSGVSGKVDSLANDFGYIRETVAEINTRIGKLDQRMVDLENTIKTMQAPPPPPSAGGAVAPSSSGPPPGVSAQSLYQDAFRDKTGGNYDLALKEFNDYLAWFGDTDFASSAQFHIGEILYNQKKFDEALPAFDKVLVAYTKNAKTNDAHLMKGRTLLRLGSRSDAEKEFRAIITANPNSDAATRARAELKDLGLSSTPRSSTRKK